MPIKMSVFVFFIVLFASVRGYSQAFDGCSSRAYLVQGDVARIYGVNLATGSYELMADSMGTQGKLNAIGFNRFDNYIYGYSSEFLSLVRIGASLQIETLSATNQPDITFYVGDVSLVENTYYAYRPGAAAGLYRVPLSPSAENYLTFERIVAGDSLNLRIYDFAFHPQNNDLYSVDNKGVLHRINPQDGSTISLGNVGQSGVFGAVYFDSDNRFYISRNNDGHIFRIDVEAQTPVAEFFAFGPSSSNNDGARCGSAPIVSDVATIDFGDAPASYGSSIADNGARHEQSDSLYFGTRWGGDDDGANWVTPLEKSANAVLVATVKGEGYVNAWADFDQSGSFDESEKIATDKPVTDGQNLILVQIPANAKSGDTWARLRVSSQLGLTPNGGVADGEVEDYAVRIDDSGVAVESYPSSQNFVTIAYEDAWPLEGDYDMNDVVFAVQTQRFTNASNNVTRYDVKGRLLAYGAGYHNGFAIALDGIQTQNIDIEKTRLFINGFEVLGAVVEDNAAADDAVLIVAQDLKDFAEFYNGCAYYRTETACTSFENLREFSFYLTVSLVAGVPSNVAPSAILNPFIFATPGIYHGDLFATPPGRGLEIHLKNKRVTSRFNPAFWGLGDDGSNEEQQFVSRSYLPWALVVPDVWNHPREKVDITRAYPNFRRFVESVGVENTTWFLSGQSNVDKTVINVFGGEL